jgi:hypothetical protein
VFGGLGGRGGIVLSQEDPVREFSGDGA